MSLLCAFVLTSCEEEESPIRFDTTQKGVKVEYYSPDPSCFEKVYFITADVNKGDVVMRCNTHSEISILGREGDAFELDGDLECVKRGEKYISKAGYWSVELVEKNALEFVFEEVPDDADQTELRSFNSVVVTAVNKNGKKVSTVIAVDRILSKGLLR